MTSIMNRISLRKATEKDIDTLIEYRLIFLKEVNGDPSDELETHLKNNLRNYFIRSLKTEEYISWFAEIENKPVGFSGMVIREQPGNFDLPNGKSGYILNIFTLKEYRNNGIASLLMHKLIEEARLKKLDRVELRATADGESVYRKLGFTVPRDKPMELSVK
jgi:ribosomal protein S18 acetylase RimI-like enzyme